MMQDEYVLFCHKVKQLTGIDLSSYKEKQMRRRLKSQMNRRGFQSFLAYYDFLTQDQQALAEFIDRITINVSEFFRNPERWLVLEQRVIPTLLDQRPGHMLKFWSAACSTGEEPYSLAMLMRGVYPQVRYSLLATDLDAKVLERAKQGQYLGSQAVQIPERFRTRFTVEEGSNLQVASEIRSAVDFRLHDLLSDRYPQDLDLIVCRNVMIYFTDEIKDRLYRQFAASLAPGGILFVGSTEQIFRARDYGFRVFDSFFYQRAE